MGSVHPVVQAKLVPVQLEGLDIYALPHSRSIHTIIQRVDFEAIKRRPNLERSDLKLFGVNHTAPVR